MSNSFYFNPPNKRIVFVENDSFDDRSSKFKDKPVYKSERFYKSKSSDNETLDGQGYYKERNEKKDRQRYPFNDHESLEYSKHRNDFRSVDHERKDRCRNNNFDGSNYEREDYHAHKNNDFDNFGYERNDLNKFRNNDYDRYEYEERDIHRFRYNDFDSLRYERNDLNRLRINDFDSFRSDGHYNARRYNAFDNDNFDLFDNESIGGQNEPNYRKRTHVYTEDDRRFRLPAYYNKRDLYTKRVKIMSKLKNRSKQEDEILKSSITIKKLITDISASDIDSLMKETSLLKISFVLAQFLQVKNHRVLFSILKSNGKVRVEKWFKETIEIEKDGGLVTKDGQKRRTPGGVFFFLMQRDTVSGD